MNMKSLAILSLTICLVGWWTLPDLVDARGGRGGGGFSRGGGGFSRGGGGSYGSIRNSGGSTTRDISRAAPRDVPRPSQGGSLPSQGGASSGQRQNVQDRTAEMSPAQKQRVQDWNANRTPEQKQQARDQAANLSPEQKQNVQDRAANRTPEQKQQLQERVANLSPEQKDQLRQKYENSGLKPEQLPGDISDENREDWQDWRDQNREDWQDWYEDQYHDYWDDRWHSSWWYGYPVSTVSFSFYIDDTPPCQKTVVINQATGTTTYYYCDSMWYQPAYTSGEVKYVVSSPPAGAELSSLAESHRIVVNGQDYYISNHVFYQKIVRNGQTLYVTVDPPPGAHVPTIPQYAVAIEHQGQTYYRFDRIFYQKQGDLFVVVANPGV
jgi:hypothetical protein